MASDRPWLNYYGEVPHAIDSTRQGESHRCIKTCENYYKIRKYIENHKCPVKNQINSIGYDR